MKRYYIETITGKVHSFTGEYLPGKERRNWHYYRTDTGNILHFRKEHMVSVEEEAVIEDDSASCGFARAY